MNKSNNLLENRIGVKAIIAGVLVSLALMFFFMALAAAVGLWSYRPEEMPRLGPQFWMAASGAWCLSAFVGSFWATLATGTKQYKVGLLNAGTTWAASYLIFGGISLSIADLDYRSMLWSSPMSLFWHGFIGDAVALMAALIAGATAVQVERGLFRREESSAQQQAHVAPTLNAKTSRTH